jgi:Starch-binding associating with outer membrane
MYTKIKKFNPLGILSLCILLGSCQKIQEFQDINTNPNGSTTVSTAGLLTSVLANMANTVGNGGANTSSLVGGLYSQYYAESTYPGTSLYADPNFSSAGTYSGNLYDCQKIINFNSDPKTAALAAANGDNGNQVQIAKILKAYHFSYITDRYGDIPYSEALQGVANLQPKYDDQEFIYKSMISDLTAAVSLLNTGGFAMKGDIAYNGNIAKWKKLANSLRLLFSLRLSEAYPGNTAYAAVEFNKAATDAAGYISTNADNFALVYPGGNIKNPYFALGQTLDNAVSSTFTSILNGLGDTRVGVLSASPTGVAFGLSSAAPSNAARVFNASYRLESSPLYFVTASHVWHWPKVWSVAG